MNDSLSHRLQALSSAEDFLRFFGVAHDERVVQVNRPLILQRFFQSLQRCEGLAELDEIGLFRRYRQLLAQSYQELANPTPTQRSKGFQDIRRHPEARAA